MARCWRSGVAGLERLRFADDGMELSSSLPGAQSTGVHRSDVARAHDGVS